MSHSGYLDARQLPITNFAHKAGVVGDDGVPARFVLTARNMAAKGRRAAALDRAHHLELAEAHMAAVAATPSGPVIAEDVRDGAASAADARASDGAPSQAGCKLS